MKLPIRHKYFEEIKSGKKDFEYRDAHITFVDEETGEELTKDVERVALVLKEFAADVTGDCGLFEDDKIIQFKLRKERI